MGLCCFKDEGSAEMDKKEKKKSESKSTTTNDTSSKKDNAPKNESKGNKAHGDEPEHFHDNDELAAQANVYRDKARKLRDDAHKPENKSNKSQLLDQADAEDAKASKLIFETLQKKQPEGTIDLHLQFVKEAIKICDEQLAIARKKGWSEMIIITGKGNHSEGGKCKIAPAVEEWIHKNGLQKENGEGKITVKL